MGMTAVFAAGRFVAELSLLAALGTTGWVLGRASAGVWFGVLLAVLLPAVAAGVWGAWVAPRAKHRLADPARMAVEGLLFGGACALLVVAHAGGWAAPLGLLWLATAYVGRRGF